MVPLRRSSTPGPTSPSWQWKREPLRRGLARPNIKMGKPQVGGDKGRRRRECETSEESMRKNETGKVKRESQSVEEMLPINLLFTSCLSLHIPSISSVYTSHTQQRCRQKCQTCAGLHQTFVESKRSLRGGNHWNMVKHGEILQVQKPLRNKSGNKKRCSGSIKGRTSR